MVSFKSILAAAASFAVAFAQSTPNIAFTSVPAVVVAGNSYNITWGGGDGSPVTLTLRKGSPDNLDTIGTLASRVTGSSYLWTVNENLATGSDYALQITQGINGINYSGLFALVGGSGTSSISYTGASRTSNATITTQGSTMPYSMSMTASAGTGTNMPRNTTFSSQSLSSTPRTITSAASTSARTTATTTQSTTVPASNIGTQMGSSIALVMGLFGAIMFLQ